MKYTGYTGPAPASARWLDDEGESIVCAPATISPSCIRGPSHPLASNRFEKWREDPRRWFHSSSSTISASGAFLWMESMPFRALDLAL